MKTARAFWELRRRPSDSSLVMHGQQGNDSCEPFKIVVLLLVFIGGVVRGKFVRKVDAGPNCIIWWCVLLPDFKLYHCREMFPVK
jgi:hypothetical protein